MKQKRIVVTQEQMIALLGMPKDSFILDAMQDNEHSVIYFTIGNHRFPDKEPFHATENIPFEYVDRKQ